jgi:hypothetical protein
MVKDVLATTKQNNPWSAFYAVSFYLPVQSCLVDIE